MQENNGFVTLNKNSTNSPEKTVIVLGVPRGGTSMVAGTIAKLGVYMGPEFRLAPTYGNREMDASKNPRSKVKERIARYNEMHKNWGVKVLPNNWLFWLTQFRLRNPVFVVVFRDIVSISKRRVIVYNSAILWELFHAIYCNLCLWVFIAFTKRPVLLVSYEKALISPKDYVKNLSSFLDIDDPALIAEAIQFVQPSPADYVLRNYDNLQLDDTETLFGYLDIVDATKIAGWAQSLSDPKPLTIEIIVNGQIKQVVNADLKRTDVIHANPSFRENCGFSIQLGEHERLQKGDRIEARVQSSQAHLTNSPYIIEKTTWLIEP